MTLEAPVADLDNQFSSPGAVALPWNEAEQHLQKGGCTGFRQCGPRDGHT
jgi:hypothetical protein